jgi:GT2 family glycosyltransferase
VARANAAGAKAACGPVVVFCEDHSFPQANWAQSLIDAHQSDWAAVGPTLFNANPKTSLSRADFLLGYGIWAEPIPAGEMEHLPGHNSAYKRDLLLSYGDRLNAMLEAESVLQWDMRQHGHRLYMQPTARVAHTNFSRFKPWAIIQFHCGRIFAATRSANWPIWKRIVYFLGSPLIPLVRFKRLMQYSRRIATSQQLGVGGVLALIWALIFDGAGQMLGYAIGAGNSLDNAHEFDRLNTHITEADRRELEAALP